YDPSVDVVEDITTEQDRVIFIKSIAIHLVHKANIRLNTRKLYTADGFAIKELMKLCNLLHDAARMIRLEDSDSTQVAPLEISSRLAQLKASRTLASEITDQGSRLYDSLGREAELRVVRQTVVTRPFELRAVEKGVSGAIVSLRDRIDATRSAMENLTSDEGTLAVKIDKKKAELERAEKRLRSLEGVRPAYMDEYEKVEVELVKLYNGYMEKFRNLTYLEQQLDEYNRQEQDKFENLSFGSALSDESMDEAPPAAPGARRRARGQPRRASGGLSDSTTRSPEGRRPAGGDASDAERTVGLRNAGDSLGEGAELGSPRVAHGATTAGGVRSIRREVRAGASDLDDDGGGERDGEDDDDDGGDGDDDDDDDDLGIEEDDDDGIGGDDDEDDDDDGDF
ncbi:Clusterin-associated protein 1, partial [Cladochytrium tenue]